MFWMWGPGWGWLAGLLSGLFWIVIIVAAVVLLRREIPNLGGRGRSSPALRILEERYARGEITREEFLERREVLRRATTPPPPPEPPPPPPLPGDPPPSRDEPTQQLGDT